MKNFISLQHAIDTMLTEAESTQKTRLTPLLESTNRILAEDIICRKSLPAFDNAAMDGYAIRLKDSGKEAKVIQTILAGENPSNAQLLNEACIKIMTGAKIPSDAEAVVPFENITPLHDGWIKLPENVQNGANIKRKGEECQEGAALLARGESLNPYHIALLASQGITHIATYAPLRIGIYSSGQEIIEPWNQALAHQIYNANGPMLYSIVRQFGFEADYLGVLPDDLGQLKKTLEKSHAYDVVLTSGGASQGEADFMEKGILESGGKIIFHGIDMKPGKPTMLAKMQSTLLLCLPGNPLSAALNMHFLGIPMLRKMQGASAYHLDTIEATNGEMLTLKGSRAHIILGSLTHKGFFATQAGKYGSGMITPLLESNSVIFCEPGLQALKKEMRLKVIPFALPFTKTSVSIFNRP